ncbi:hypothetical protein CR983_02635 [Candidatus Saccharibacteria bacterium]|nr:MAG: hypothetical protein CR983_02635 [Candidatus Saccharibacteria bacterium]
MSIYARRLQRVQHNITQPPFDEDARIASVFAEIVEGSRELYLQRKGNHYFMFYGIQDGMYARHELVARTGNGSDGPLSGPEGVHMLRGVSAVKPLAIEKVEDSMLTGTSWATSTSGDYTWQRTHTAGDKASWGVPANATMVGIHTVLHGTGGGVATVKIDGDPFAATMLPTALELVEARRLEPTALNTNGGTLDPDQRCYSSYLGLSGSRGAQMLFATGLDPTIRHTVEIEHSGYAKPNASSNAQRRIGIVGFASDGAAATIEPNAIFVINELNYKDSAWEYATSWGSPTAERIFMGTYHGNEHEDSLTVTIDGAETTLSDGDFVRIIGSAELTKVGYLNHPTAGRVADVNCTYRLTTQGLHFTPVISWREAGTCYAAYAMMIMTGPLEPKYQPFSRAMTSMYQGPVEALPSTIPLDQDFAKARSAAAWVWSKNYAAIIHIEDIEQWVDQWQYTERESVVEARNISGMRGVTSIAKVYISRVKSETNAEPVTSSTVHQYTARVRVGYLAGGTEALETL